MNYVYVLKFRYLDNGTFSPLLHLGWWSNLDKILAEVARRNEAEKRFAKEDKDACFREGEWGYYRVTKWQS